ncbi:MAG TPA: cyclic nucleotide-binding domain-containing protein [Rectinemataceae bacterium]|nr:cyclic nucleotide-binding domain-containing protein [Rectinemataceae bacterium]
MGEEQIRGYPQTKLVRFAAGQELFREGSAGREMYIIRSGRVRVSISKGGLSVPITELGKGCHVGEMSFIASIPRTATVTALEPVIANRISPDILSDDNLSISGWAISIARVLVERIKRTTEILGDYMASGPHPMPAESIPSPASRRAEFSMHSATTGGTILLKGVFSKEKIDQVKETVRQALLKNPSGITIDFSGIMDIGADALAYLLQLAKSAQARDGKIQLRNLQLIRNKIAGMKEIQNLIKTSNLPLRRIEDGDYLIRQGERERSMFIIRSGEFDILGESEGQDPLLLGNARAGDVVGELSLLKEGERTASVRAVKGSVVLEITPKEFYANIYTVPEWFMQIIDGLVQRLRNTDEMLTQVTSLAKPAEVPAAMEAPLSIQLDASAPGTFVLSGTLNLANMEHFVPIIRQLLFLGQKELVINMEKIEQIDKESIRYLLNLFMIMKENGGHLSLIGNHKYLLWLKKHNAEDSIAGMRGEEEVKATTAEDRE